MFFLNKKSKPKKWKMVFLIFILLFFVGLKFYYDFYTPKDTVRVGDGVFNVYVAKLPDKWHKGLSGKEDLGKYDGMLFKFYKKGQHAIVMRDMYFPIDIVWIDGNKVVDIAPNVEPEPDKAEADLTVYLSRLPANYVLELKAGTMEKYGLKIGDNFTY